jgi:hypothetical protein
MTRPSAGVNPTQVLDVAIDRPYASAEVITGRLSQKCPSARFSFVSAPVLVDVLREMR